MIALRNFGLLAMFAVPCTSFALASDDARLDSSTVVYETPARTSFEEIGGGLWSVGTSPPKIRTREQNEDAMFGEVVGEKLVDCSDGQFRCVSAWTRTYAVPRRRLSPVDVYEKGGVTFRVEQCLRGDANICQVALIGGYCAESSDGRCVAQPPENRPAQWGYVTYFLYNEDIGITAMGVTETPSTSTEGKMSIATQSVLQGPSGLLRE